MKATAKLLPSLLRLRLRRPALKGEIVRGKISDQIPESGHSELLGAAPTVGQLLECSNNERIALLTNGTKFLVLFIRYITKL